MRPRTLLTFTAGVATGAGWMYLSDPEHGPRRRRDARREAVRRARAGAVELAADTRRRAEEVTRAAVAGYQQGRSGEEVVVAPPQSVWRRLVG